MLTSGPRSGDFSQTRVVFVCELDTNRQNQSLDCHLLNLSILVQNLPSRHDFVIYFHVPDMTLIGIDSNGRAIFPKLLPESIFSVIEYCVVHRWVLARIGKGGSDFHVLRLYHRASIFRSELFLDG